MKQRASSLAYYEQTEIVRSGNLRSNRFMEEPLLQFFVKRPRACSPKEIARFGELVREGGEVEAERLDARIKRAAYLVFFQRGPEISGIAAVKNPTSNHRQLVESSAKFGLLDADYQHELGWVFVSKKERGRGLAGMLVKCALDAALSAGIFATSRCDNTTMHRILQQCGFVRRGEQYPSKLGDQHLLLFVRAKPLIPLQSLTREPDSAVRKPLKTQAIQK